MDKRKGEGVVCLHKEWAGCAEPFPLQTTILDIASFAPEYKEQATTLTELFPVGSHCFLTSSSYYGREAEVRWWKGGEGRRHWSHQHKGLKVSNSLLSLCSPLTGPVCGLNPDACASPSAEQSGGAQPYPCDQEPRSPCALPPILQGGSGPRDLRTAPLSDHWHDTGGEGDPT